LISKCEHKGISDLRVSVDCYASAEPQLYIVSITRGRILNIRPKLEWRGIFVSAQPADVYIDSPERSLDPEDWEELRELGHRAIDDVVEYLKTVGERPVWQPLPQASRDLFAGPPPLEPTPRQEVYDQVRDHVLPYPTGNIHPRFWSWVGGTGTATQVIADLVISTMNAGGLGFDEVASTHVEIQLLDWLKALLGYPAEASGLLVSGGSMANLVGLAVARTHAAPYDLRKSGIDTNNHPRLVYYASSEAHSCIRKAIELIGLGSDSLHTIPVRHDFTIDIDELHDAIASDRAAGHRPACIIANVGTVNTGAIDPVNVLVDLALQEDMWVHADAAFGAFTKLSHTFASIVDGIERVDSLAFDLHKWLYVQYDCGGVFVRAPDVHRNTFSVIPSYIRNFDRGLASGPINFSEYGVQLSRSFKALRAWMGLKTEGVARYGEQIEQNIQQARYLSSLIDNEPDLERLAPTALNIVNFRFVADGIDDERLDVINAEILMRLQERGIAAPSSTMLRGRFSIRVAICNHRSRRSDFAALVSAVKAIGHEVLS
jgi:aromatic-L-amino-acid decarboxylase